MTAEPFAELVRPTEPRIEPLTEFDGELAEIMATALTHDGQPLNIFGTLGKHPKLLKRFNLLGGFLLNKGMLPARERELVILRVGANARAEYEFGQHTVIGRDCGLTDDEIAALTRAPDRHDWSADDLALIALADELHADDCVTDATWSDLARRWDDAQLVELLVVAGFYRLVSGFLNSTGVQLDDGIPGFPTTQ
ncbi:MAG: carboxymuconolactone decarboxylase family protein [Ilumatobacter sp.]|nr:carboxymuconolactone decarboxylase family protein [bacterium]MDG1267172.1 carboxymuconolactone decarboxylase family protein [Ilumatobacter sp.]MDG2039161.1 carboxymuconolactone decarboxylase family protein [Ilumatobacter sp.]